MNIERNKSTSREKMRRYRERLRESGLRPIQLWVPDIRGPKFSEEARRQSRLAAAHASENEALDAMEAATDFDAGS